MDRFKIFTGGVLDTNSFLYPAPNGNLLFDAPQGADAAWAGTRIDLLLLTHGHFDHIADAAAIARRHGCPVGYHAETAPMTEDKNFFRGWGFELEIETFSADFLIEEGTHDFLGLPVNALYVPGHCPGSLCFLLPSANALVGGDVLFSGGIGRWDLPGGDRELLLGGIRSKLLPLDDHIRVLPGHGPATTIGEERRNNPFLAA